ncbi:MAG: glycerol dehydrogenase, partial [Kiritimatiellaeota bacterium]|nr:glycerol dehydrogenase [Kiritimatiellota bacterium]
MNKVFIAPRRYVQGAGAIGEAGALVSKLGTRVMVLWDAQVRGVVGDVLLASLAGAGVAVED